MQALTFSRSRPERSQPRAALASAVAQGSYTPIYDK